MKPLTLEVSSRVLVHIDPHPNIMITPAINEEFWHFRVNLSNKNAVVAFPKFLTLGIGFQHEEDWNTNLPYSVDAEKIYAHIKHNKADNRITKQRAIEAIRLLQSACIKAKERTQTNEMPRL